MADEKIKSGESPETEIKKSSEKCNNVRLSNYLQVFISLIAVLVAIVFWKFQNQHQKPLIKANFKSYKEACTSGQFNSLKDLHRYVEKDITTYDGEMERDEFLNTYYWRAKPVLMKGAAKKWPALTQWTDDFLVNNFYDTKFYVDLRKHHFTGNPVRTKLNLGKFLNNYKKKEWYLDSMTADDRFLDMMDVPKYLNISGIFTTNEDDISEFYHNLYLSSGNTDSPLHYDGYSNLLTVLDGTKEWIIADPTEANKLRLDDWVDHPNLSPMNVTNFNISDFPDICNVSWYRAVLHPGDTLFVPIMHPHHVFSPPGRNLAVGMWFSLKAYSDQLIDMGFHEEDKDGRGLPVAKMLEILKKHVDSRAHPCDVTDCTPLPSGSSTLRTMLYDNLEDYSRDGDIPPPNIFQMKVLNREDIDIPGICYGTGLPESSIDNVYVNTLMALNMGYKFVDTAVMYGNEREIGNAVRDSKWVRRSVTVVTKFEYTKLKGQDYFSETVEVVEGSLERLGMEYVDILLLHDTELAPLSHLTDVWRAMEDLTKAGKVRAIGLSNTDVPSLDYISEIATVPISIVQNLFTPFEYDMEVFEYCKESDILFMGFGMSGDFYLKSGFEENPVQSHPLIGHLAKLYDTSTHAILYNWAAQKHIIIISRSTKLQHMKENLSYRDVFLNVDHMNEIDNLFDSDITESETDLNFEGETGKSTKVDTGETIEDDTDKSTKGDTSETIEGETGEISDGENETYQEGSS